MNTDKIDKLENLAEKSANWWTDLLRESHLKPSKPKKNRNRLFSYITLLISKHKINKFKRVLKEETFKILKNDDYEYPLRMAIDDSPNLVLQKALSSARISLSDDTLPPEAYLRIEVERNQVLVSKDESTSLEELLS